MHYIGADLILDTVTHVSENILLCLMNEPSPKNDDGGFGSTCRDLLGQNLSTILPADLLHDLRNTCGLPAMTSQRERVGVYSVCQLTELQVAG